MKLIDKDKVIAKIERLQYATMDEDMNFYSAKAEAEFCVLSDLENFIDSLEAKDIDLDKEINLWFDYGFPNDEELLDYIKETAKHFYELGLKAKE